MSTDLEDRLREQFRENLAVLPISYQPVESVKPAAVPRPGVGWPRRSRRLVLGAAAVVAVSVAVTATPSLRPGDGGAAAAPLLNAAAAAAEQGQPRPVPRLDQFLYLRGIGSEKSEELLGPRCGVVYERWEAADGRRSGRILRVDGVKVPGPRWQGDPLALPEQPGCHRLVTDVSSPPEDAAGSWSEPTPAFIAGLPTTTKEMYERARRDAIAEKSDWADQETFELLGYLLDSNLPYLTPRLRSTALRAMALVPGVRQHGWTTDAIGRRGVAVSGPKDNPGDRILVDPHTGEVLGDAGDFTVTRSTGVVDSTTQRPNR